MKTFKKIMYVVDPTNNHQKGLGRVADGAKHLSAALHLYACMPLPKLSSTDARALRQAELERLRLWLDWIAKPAQDAGVQVTTEAEIADVVFIAAAMQATATIAHGTHVVGARKSAK